MWAPKPFPPSYIHIHLECSLLFKPTQDTICLNIKKLQITLKMYVLSSLLNRYNICNIKFEKRVQSYGFCMTKSWQNVKDNWFHICGCMSWWVDDVEVGNTIIITNLFHKICIYCPSFQQITNCVAVIKFFHSDANYGDFNLRKILC